MAWQRRRRPSGKPTYFERLRTPWAWYPVAVGISALLAAEFGVAGFPLTVWIPFGVMIPLGLLLVWWLGQSTLQIADDELWVREAHLPFEVVTGAVALDARTLRLVVGREGDPAAFVSIRPWIGPGVQLWLDDPDDPTPYWVVSTRRPDEFVGQLRRCITAASPDTASPETASPETAAPTPHTEEGS